jgi:hypothetical protein
LADEARSKTVLVKVLTALLDAIKKPESAQEVQIESFTLIRFVFDNPSSSAFADLE